MLTDLPDPCRVCGFDSATLTTADLQATIASLARRWRGVLVRDDDAATAVPPGGGDSAATLAGGSVAWLRWATAAVQAADRGTPAPAPPTTSTPASADALAEAASALADASKAVAPDHQKAAAPAASKGAHAGVHPLRAAQAAVDAVVAARD